MMSVCISSSGWNAMNIFVALVYTFMNSKPCMLVVLWTGELYAQLS